MTSVGHKDVTNETTANEKKYDTCIKIPTDYEQSSEIVICISPW